MHIVSIVDKASITTDGRRNVEKSLENGHGNGGYNSFAEKKKLFEQLTTTKANGASKTGKGENGQQQPPPKPVRTFAHDQYLSLKELAASSTISAVDFGTTSTKAGLSPKPSPSPRLHLKPKPPVVARRQKTSARGDGHGVYGVSHEYEHLLATRSPLVVRQQHLRRSLSDDPVAYAESRNLKAIFDVSVEPIFYASSPVPRQSPNKEDNRIYDTPVPSVNGKSKSASKLHRRPRDSLPLNRERSEEKSKDADEEIDVDDLNVSSAAIDKRVNRARLMRRRTLMHYDQQEIAFIKRQLPQLFELAALVRLEPNDGSNPMISRDQKYAPTVIYRFPPPADHGKPDDGSITASLSCLCYPDISKAVLTSPETYKDEQFVMTITDQFGDRKFAYCYRFVPMTTVIERSTDRLSPTGKVVKVMSQNSSSSFYSSEIVLSELPQVFCVVTPVQAPNFYSDFVREAAMKAKRVRTDQSIDGDDLADLKEFLQEAFYRPLPPPGGRLVVNGSWSKEVVVSHRMSTCKGISTGLSTLVERIGVDHAMLLFTSLLSERRVLVVGESVPAVSKAVQAAAAVLAPFEWPHTLVPVVPDPYVHLCFSPTPYLMGLLRSNLHFLKDLLVGRRPRSNGCQNDEDDEEYLLILDLDYGVLKDKDFTDYQGSGSSAAVVQRCLPSRTGRSLKQNLRNAVTPSTDLTATATATILQEAKDAKVAEAFLVTFVDLIGHYKEFMVTQQDGHVTFQKQQFVSDAMTESQRAFLKWFVETGMFQIWLKKKVDAAMNGGSGTSTRSLTLGAAAASDAFDRKLAQTKARQSQGSAAYQALLSAVARTWTSLLRKAK